LEIIKRMPKANFDVILLPALQAANWPTDGYSEDLVFSDGAYETPGSQAEESDN